MTDARKSCPFCGTHAKYTGVIKPSGVFGTSNGFFRCSEGHAWGIPTGYDPVLFDYLLVA